MLPDYISGVQEWEQLVKLREDQFSDANIQVHKGLEIVNIDRKNKVVIDSNGDEHTYDRLILGMGSRAFMPPSVPKIPGIFNMRSRLDADGIMPFMNQKNPHALIVGGGLLGLELAASLREINVQVTIVQRISRFMDRQLDQLGADLLYEEMINLGIDIYFNDEVAAFYGTDKFEGVRLKSGRKIDAQVAIFAIGTSPNVEIARAAGLEVNRGVVVNDYLQTSDPDIFAAGFMAVMYGVAALVVYVVMVQMFKVQVDLQTLIRTMGYAAFPLAFSVVMFIPFLWPVFAIVPLALLLVTTIYAVQSATGAASNQVVLASLIGFAVFVLALGLISSTTTFPKAPMGAGLFGIISDFNN